MASKCECYKECGHRHPRCKNDLACDGYRTDLRCYNGEDPAEPMSDRQIELADQIMKLCLEYRSTFDENKPFVWIDNHETGEFLCYTLGEANQQMKNALGRI